MPGERTSDSSGGHRVAGDDNLISLREHVQRQLDGMRIELDREFAAMMMRLDERATSQRVAGDVAFVAQTTAMQTAMTTAQREVQAALLSAEKAVTKSELASDKRFEAVNEFRGQLADQANTFMPRNEADARFKAIGDKLDAEYQRLAQRITEGDQRNDTAHRSLTSRLDLMTGASKGLDKAWAVLLGAVGFAGGVIAIVISTR